MPSLVGPRQGHLASGAMHSSLLLLHFSRLSLSLRLRARSNAPCVVAPLQLPCGGCIQTRPFLSLLVDLPLNSRVDRLHSYSHLYPSLYPPSVLLACPASPRLLFAFELPRDLRCYRRRSARNAPLFSFSYPVNPRPLLSPFLSASPALSL